MGLLGLLLAACAPIEEHHANTWDACESGRSADCDSLLVDDFGAESPPEFWLDGVWELARVCSVIDAPLEESEHVSPDFVHWVSQAPGDTSGAMLYNRVASAVRATSFDSGGTYTTGRDVVFQVAEEAEWSVAASMVHESGHASGDPNHDACDTAGSGRCDRNWKGAYAKEVGFVNWAAATETGLSGYVGNATSHLENLPEQDW